MNDPIRYDPQRVARLSEKKLRRDERQLFVQKTRCLLRKVLGDEPFHRYARIDNVAAHAVASRSALMTSLLSTVERKRLRRAFARVAKSSSRPRSASRRISRCS